MLNIADAQRQREQAKQKAIALNQAAMKEGRDLTEAEKVEYDAHLSEIRAIQAQLDKHAAGATSAPRTPGALNLGGGNGLDGKDGNVDARFPFAGIADFLKDGSGAIRASLSEGSDLAYIVPSYEVDSFLAAYPNVDPFAAAGATITDLPGPWSEGRVPFVLAGDEPSVYAEGTGPTTDESASVVVVRLNDPKKIGFLSKPTEEAMEDIPALASALGQEGIRRTRNKTTKQLTADLLTSLNAASATVMHSGDNLEDLLNMIAAIPSFFASSSNAFMGSRSTLALIRNTRVGANNQPVFDPTTNRILGFSFIQNDFVPGGKLIFGDFGSSVHLRRAGLHFLQLNEAYREAGKIGLRFTQRADWAFFSEAANNSTVEQPLYLLTSDFGS
jgi:HK97 family phage major capsid protein